MSITDGPKLFVLDTNVILHDAGCLDRFEENDIVIPITVLEELDRFKRGGETINLQAREFLRRLDRITGDVLSPDGAPIGDGLGNLRVVLAGPTIARIEEAFTLDTPDHRILNCTLHLHESAPDRRIILVTKDVNLRLKARSIGVTAQDYTADKVKNFESIYTGHRTVDGLPTERLDAFFTGDRDASLDPASLPEVENPSPNEHFVLRNGSASVLARYRYPDGFQRVTRPVAYGITPRNAEQAFALDLLLDDEVKLVTLQGKAGTGKTLLALAAALESRRNYRQILLARPVVPLSNRDLGFLPGDIDAKIDPYMQPLFDNLAVIREGVGIDSKAGARIARMQEDGKLLVTPLAYIRGRSLQRVFFIIDEAQNLTPHEIKTIITRAGEGTKIVFTGDIRQIDTPYLDALSNGLSYLIHRMVGQPLYAHVTLEKGERSALSDLAGNLL